MNKHREQRSKITDTEHTFKTDHVKITLQQLADNTKTLAAKGNTRQAKSVRELCTARHWNTRDNVIYHRPTFSHNSSLDLLTLLLHGSLLLRTAGTALLSNRRALLTHNLLLLLRHRDSILSLFTELHKKITTKGRFKLFNENSNSNYIC